MSKVSGWYYDLHQDWKTVNRLTTVSLHANSYYRGEDDWGYSPVVGNRDKDLKEGGTDVNRGDGKNPDYDEDGYYYEPICTCVLQEDFQIQVQNQWTDMGDDKTGNFINSLRTSIVPFAGTISQGLYKMGEGNEKFKKELEARGELANSFTGQILMPIVDWLNEKLNGKNKDGSIKDNNSLGEANMAKYLNSAILVDGSRFSVYQGSNINFGNMGMRFTVIPKWDPETGVFITVVDQLKDLYRYFFGEFMPLPNDWGNESVRSVVTFQRPPGGYQADMAQLDATQRGSLKLKIGGNYAICNVVVESATLVYSKQMVKNPLVTHQLLMDQADVKGNDYLTPLSCDVNLVLRPCTRYSDHTLKNIVEGAGMNKERQEIRDTLIEHLKDEMLDYLMYEPTYIVDPTDNLELKKQYNAMLKRRSDFQKQLEAKRREEEEYERLLATMPEEEFLTQEDVDKDRERFAEQLRASGIPEDVIQYMISHMPTEELKY